VGSLQKANRKPGRMNHMQAVFLIAIAGSIAGGCGASAQTIQPETKGVPEQSTFVEKPSAVSRVKAWTRARWEDARKHWSHDNAKFYACSNRWREQTSGRKYSLHDQRKFLFQCMNNANVTQLAEPSVLARASTWAREHWAAERVRWARDHGKFYECRDKLLEESRIRRFSAHDGKDRFFRCMNDLS
jgi:predicted transposase YbfD/YdcC